MIGSGAKTMMKEVERRNIESNLTKLDALMQQSYAQLAYKICHVRRL